jgi:hypothetical protein
MLLGLDDCDCCEGKMEPEMVRYWASSFIRMCGRCWGGYRKLRDESKPVGSR